ncbi:biopolymer transport protein ExbD [Yoonia maricola]|uniref:Biopolymer transport protein ExbD n=1 Tax=Yoonia maricola TaxID=420999 RepID=A0A2M8VZY5_9RHOB|nr:biopolymer transporter ExbD [Yoonia maricola]PJI84233.1 biopolymer transport protein ExbD [Yoonia maricola]
MATTYTPLPERPRRYRVPLTPLADAMFQLLIFFMLTTTLTPFSLVTVRSTPDAAEQGGPDTSTGAVDEEALQQASASSRNQATVWELGDGQVIVDGQQFEITQLSLLAEALGTQNTPANLIVLVTDAATVQDVTTALEALGAAEITAVQLARSR